MKSKLGLLTRALFLFNLDSSLALSWQTLDFTALSNGHSMVLSTAGTGNESSWHRVPVPCCTLIGCLHEAGVPPWKDLGTQLFSDNLESHRNHTVFNQPWLYRREFLLTPHESKHFLLETHGITPAADIFLNGVHIATPDVQSGSYGGHVYDVTAIVNTSNAVVIKVYPTDYIKDLAIGFIDWNPYPPDHGTGVWRNVTVRQSGPVALGPLSIGTTFLNPDLSQVQVTISSVVRNLENRTVTIVPTAQLEDSGARISDILSSELSLAPFETSSIVLQSNHTGLPIWWPKQWGQQPLLQAQLNITVGNELSDTRKALFGVREVTSALTKDQDRIFYVNKQPFEVIGAGYAPDIFLQWNGEHFTNIAEYALDIGLNTIRLEGKLEHPELYDIADRLGLMVLPGWECCGKWEAWRHNDGFPTPRIPYWNRQDYSAAEASMRHEAAMLQPHPSILGFLVGSDTYPDDRAATIYANALREANWQTPVIAAASNKRHSKLLGPSGMKMEGPYDWVPPTYWWDTDPPRRRRGAAFGFGSELGAGVGTPEIGSLLKFLDWKDVDQLWQPTNKKVYHNGRGRTFSSRKVYDSALWHRYGPPTGWADYLIKAQMMDYEATRAQFEAYSSKWSDQVKRPATGMIYWMLNNAWPSLHWNLFDVYLRAAGAYFGAKTGSRLEHVAYDYASKKVHLINHSLDRQGKRTVELDIIDTNGTTLSHRSVSAMTIPNRSEDISLSVHELDKLRGLVFLRLLLHDEHNVTLSRNIYWLTGGRSTMDKPNWRASDWYHTPVKAYADLRGLNHLPPANLSVVAAAQRDVVLVTLENQSDVPAVFVRLNLVNRKEHEIPQMWEDVLPVKWEDNYVTLWPRERMTLAARLLGDVEAGFVQVSGRNVVTPEIVPITTASS